VTPLQAPPIDYGAIAPLLIVLGGACVSVLLEAFLPRHQRWPAQVALTVLVVVVAGIALGAYAGSAPGGGVVTLASALAVDTPTLFLWGTLLVLGFGALLLIADRSVEPGGAFVANAVERASVGAAPGSTTGGAGVDPEHVDRSYGAPGEAPTMQTEIFPFTLLAVRVT